MSKYESYICVIVLLLNAFLILPERDSLSLYLDNPVHLAELYELAFNLSGWSEIGFLGFPLESLHSPLWYGLCAWFVRWGMNAELVYQVAIYIGLVAPALAIFWVSRRYTESWLGFLIALQVLLLHHAVSGLGSAPGGMWTYYIACSLAVILLEKLRYRCSKQHFAHIVLLTSTISLTHLFVLYYIAILILCIIGLSIISRNDRRDLLLKASALVFGVFGAVWYWGPIMLASQARFLSINSWSIEQILRHFLIGVEDLYVHGNDIGLLFYWKNIPAQSLCLFTLAGVVFYRKKILNRLGILSTFTLVVLMIFSTLEEFNVILGPVPWRFCTLVALGMALMEIEMYRQSSNRSMSSKKAFVFFGCVAVSFGVTLICRQPLWKELTSRASSEYQDIQKTWTYLRENIPDKSQRIYVQDTFWAAPFDRDFVFSHVLSLTSKETGLYQAGAYYGIAPYRTLLWLYSAGNLLGEKLDNIDRIMERIVRGGFRYLVISSPEATDVLVRNKDFIPLFNSGNFTIVEYLPNKFEDIVIKSENVATPQVTEFGPGKISLSIPTRETDIQFTLRESFHDFWRAGGCSDAQISQENDGLMRIEVSPGAQCELSLIYNSPIWPAYVTVVIVLLFSLMMICYWKEPVAA